MRDIVKLTNYLYGIKEMMQLTHINVNVCNTSICVCDECMNVLCTLLNEACGLLDLYTVIALLFHISYNMV